MGYHRPGVVAGGSRRLQLGVQRVLMGDGGFQGRPLRLELGLGGAGRVACRLGRAHGVHARRTGGTQVGDGLLVGLERLLQVDVWTSQVFRRSGEPVHVGLHGARLKVLAGRGQGRRGAALAGFGRDDGGLIMFGVVGLRGDTGQEGITPRP
jgi:hypothetical protein